jgi:hypothetical protein
MGRDADTIILSQFIDALENAGLLDVDWDENWDMLDLYFQLIVNTIRESLSFEEDYEGDTKVMINGEIIDWIRGNHG